MCVWFSPLLRQYLDCSFETRNKCFHRFFLIYKSDFIYVNGFFNPECEVFPWMSAVYSMFPEKLQNLNFRITNGGGDKPGDVPKKAFQLVPITASNFFTLFMGSHSSFFRKKNAAPKNTLHHSTPGYTLTCSTINCGIVYLVPKVQNIQNTPCISPTVPRRPSLFVMVLLLNHDAFLA